MKKSSRDKSAEPVGVPSYLNEEEEPMKSSPPIRTDDAFFLEQVALRKGLEPKPPVESLWAYVTPLPELNQPDLVATGEVECNICGGSGYQKREQVGMTYGGKRFKDGACRCAKPKAYSFVNKKLLLNDRGVRFDTLAPNVKSHMPIDMQAEQIAFVKANVHRSFLICGPPGWSKSTYSLAIYDYVVREQIDLSSERSGRFLLDAVTTRFPIWRVYADNIIEEIKNCRYKDGFQPTVSERKIREAAASGWVPRLFIEEIEKIGKVTPDRMLHLWNLIKTVYDCRGQVVITSNFTPEELEATFGGDTVRRITRANDDDEMVGEVLDFFNIGTGE